MTDKAKSLFHEFDHGRSSRRQLLKALGIAMALCPTSAFAQGVCGVGKPAAGTPDCDPAPAKLPFEPTGWKTVHLDIFCQVADYPKEAAYYAALMNWKIRSDDGNQAVLDINDRCRFILRGGYQAPPPADGVAAAAPRQGDFDSFCWGITPWNAKKVEAELRKRGLEPMADHSNGFESFHVKDPDGFDFQISNGRKIPKPHPAKDKTSAAAPFEPTNWKTVWLDHISFEVPNYKQAVAFYTALLGWKSGTDEGSQNQCEIGDIGDITIRRKRGAKGAPPAPGVAISHLSFGISPFDPDQVKADLEKRGLVAKEDTGGKGDIHSATALYKSFHTVTPNGFNLQISAATEATRILSSLD